MIAIVSIAGQQYKVEKNEKFFVHRLDEEEGSSVDFDQVLLIDNNGKIKIGTPYLANTVVSAKVLSHLKGDKVTIFKKKKRKGYRKHNCHRQFMTELLIEDILENTTARKKSESSAKKIKKEVEVKETKPLESKAKDKEVAKKEGTEPVSAEKAKTTTPKAKSPAAKTKATVAKKEVKTAKPVVAKKTSKPAAAKDKKEVKESKKPVVKPKK